MVRIAAPVPAAPPASARGSNVMSTIVDAGTGIGGPLGVGVGVDGVSKIDFGSLHPATSTATHRSAAEGRAKPVDVIISSLVAQSHTQGQRQPECPHERAGC